MIDEKLIALVRQHEGIYNKDSPDYKFLDKKIEIWQNIAMEMGESEVECIKRWTSLRERYVKECRQEVASAEYGELYHSPWTCFDDMHFLKPHIAYRSSLFSNTLTNETTQSTAYALNISVASPPTEATQQDQSPASPDQSYPTFIPKASPASSLEDLSFDASLPLQPVSPTPASTTQLKPTAAVAPSQPLTTKHDNKMINLDKLFVEAVRDFKKVCEAQEVELKNPVIQGFKEMLVATISSMSERKQAKAMQKATEIVMSIKLEPDD